MSKLLSEVSYRDLVSSIKKEIASGIVDVQKMVDQKRKATYWNIGALISSHILKGASRPGYGVRLYARIGEELNIHPRTISQMVQFYNNYPVKPVNKQLTFSHYAVLLRIKDKRKRLMFEKKTVTLNLTVEQLREILKQEAINLKNTDIVSCGKLKVVRGKLFTYRTKEIKNVHVLGIKIEIDLGFDISIDKPKATLIKLSRGKIIVSNKIKKEYILEIKKARPTQDLYTYVAYIERVIDADTIIAKIDCGFGVRIRQRLRFRGIDAPEMKTMAGEKAKAFVLERLKVLSFVVIKTYGSDKYDRYLADIFYFPKERDPHVVASEGKYLNQELLDQGLATVWK